MLNLLIQYNPYLFSLIITVVIEGLATLLLTRKFQLVLASMFINLITHPWAYYFYLNHQQLVIIEVAVVLLEAGAWYLLLKNWRKAVVLSLSTNVLSELVGFGLSR